MQRLRAYVADARSLYYNRVEDILTFVASGAIHGVKICADKYEEVGSVIWTNIAI